MSEKATNNSSVLNPVTVLHTVQQVREWSLAQKMQGKTIGFVPTMGALHAGHLHLVTVAAQRSDSVIVSIFVNPAQFAPHEDLDKYPRTMEKDIEKLEQTQITTTPRLGTPIAVFAPSVAEMYPRGISTHRGQQRGTFVEVLGLSEMLEGGTRPHFFRGVATVVSKLFHIVMPDYAVFGQKDIQQCCVLRAMVQDLHFPLTLVVASTERDTNDGLALSSRNVYLTEEQRNRAPAFYRGMCRARDLFQSGITDREELLAIVREEAQKGDLDIEYISLSSPDTLMEVSSVSTETGGAILSGAWRMGSTRLIDNMLLGFEF
ncbi:pantoate-beta-alanine ligase [Coemansia sp. RSA 1933]|nr:pantoate-beta-alanine ligase [Coemansia sp. RSA 1933]